MGIDRTYMSTFFFDLNNELLICWEQLARLLRDTLHMTAIKRQTTHNTFYHTPEYALNGVLFSSTMEEAGKFI